MLCSLFLLSSVASPGRPSGADRELSLKAPSGEQIKLLLHGQAARSVSTTEEGSEVFFGPLKVVRIALLEIYVVDLG